MQFGLWLSIPRQWERPVAQTMRGTIAAHTTGDPGPLVYESMEILEGQADAKHSRALKSRLAAQAATDLARQRGG